MRNLIILLLPLLFFNSCIDISDELILNSDGSGTFKYSVNLGKSIIKVNSVLALDSLDGKKVPSIPEIKKIIQEYKVKLENKEGISNVKVDTDFKYFFLKFSCEFDNVENLQQAIKEIAIEHDKKHEFKELTHIWLTWNGLKLVRYVPALTLQITQNMKREDYEALKKGKYTSITRFDRPIERCENSIAKIPPSKLVCAIITTPYALIQNIKLLENTIYLSNDKQTE